LEHTAVREKLLGNPRLLVTIGIEIAIGLTAKMIAEVQTRKEEFWKEGAFVASDLVCSASSRVICALCCLICTI
jgi:hypothetical protein